MLQGEATEGALQQEIIEGLYNWFEGNEALPSTQTKIGWFQLAGKRQIQNKSENATSNSIWT